MRFNLPILKSPVVGQFEKKIYVSWQTSNLYQQRTIWMLEWVQDSMEDATD